MGPPANSAVAEQAKLSKLLLDAMSRNNRTILDNTEAVDGLREVMEEVSKQLERLKVDITKETIEETEPVDGG